MRIGIVGSRRRNTVGDYEKVLKALAKVLDENMCNARSYYGYVNVDFQLVSGGCSRGADCFVPKLNKIFCLQEPLIHKPMYDLFGNAATFIRNSAIAKDSDVLIACVAKDRTGGTEDTIKKFQRFHPEGKLILV